MAEAIALGTHRIVKQSGFTEKQAEILREEPDLEWLFGAVIA